MRISFRDLWRWDGEVDRGVYALAGFLGFALKHHLDRVVATVAFGLRWDIFNYWVSPFELIPPPPLSSPQGKLIVTLVALALPFIWFGVTMTVRRLRSAGLPLWLAALFFAPFVNLLFFVILCVLPSRDALTAAPTKDVRSPSWLDRFIPRNPVGSAAMGMLATNLLFVPLVWWSTFSLATYGMGLFVGMPFCMGLVSALIFGYHGPRNVASYMIVAAMSLLLTGALLLGFAIEGVVCVMMAAPIAFPLALGGAAVAYAMQRPFTGRPQSSQVFPAVLLALPALIAVEHATLPEPPVFAVRTAVEIEAPPEAVWRHVISFSELPPPTEFLFRMGIAYPIKAEIHGKGVGAERRCVFSTGSFVEPIEVWDEPLLLKFSVTSNPPPMEEWTPYEEVHPPHLEGFLSSNGGQFLLDRLPGGRTRLEALPGIAIPYGPRSAGDCGPMRSSTPFTCACCGTSRGTWKGRRPSRYPDVYCLVSVTGSGGQKRGDSFLAPTSTTSATLGSIHKAPLELVSAGVRRQAAMLRERFLSAQPFRHLVVDDFLDHSYCRQLIAEFPAFDDRKALNEFGKVGGKAVCQNLPELGPAYAAFDRLLRSREFLALVGEMTGIPDLLYDPDYIGGGTHENLSGQELDPHVDFNYHPKTRTHRRLNLILFLNPAWKEEWGGSLELHLNPWLPPEQNRISAILPLANRAVLFETSEHSWHGFSRIQAPEGRKLSRRSAAVYFYTKQRPPEETAPDHATIYVQRPLPAHIQAGHTLEERDVQAIRELLDRRDQQIKFLYERETKFASTLSGIIHSPTFRFARLLGWPLRKLRDAVKGGGPAES